MSLWSASAHWLFTVTTPTHMCIWKQRQSADENQRSGMVIANGDPESKGKYSLTATIKFPLCKKGKKKNVFMWRSLQRNTSSVERNFGLSWPVPIYRFWLLMC